MKISELARLSSWWEINRCAYRRNRLRVLALGCDDVERFAAWGAFKNAAISFTGIAFDAEIVKAARFAFPGHTWIELPIHAARGFFDEDQVWDLILIGADADPRVIDFAFERAVLWVAVAQRGDTPLLSAPTDEGIDEFVRDYDDGDFTIFERI